MKGRLKGEVKIGKNCSDEGTCNSRKNNYNKVRELNSVHPKPKFINWFDELLDR